MSQLLHSTTHQVMWYFWVFIVNRFFLLWSIYFFSRKLYFLWPLCLFFFAESISLDTSGKPTVRFFLKITSPSWIILSISFDELNSINWLLLKSWWWIFLKFHFIVIKEFWYDKKKLEGCWRIYLNMFFFKYYCEY